MDLEKRYVIQHSALNDEYCASQVSKEESEGGGQEARTGGRSEIGRRETPGEAQGSSIILVRSAKSLFA